MAQLSGVDADVLISPSTAIGGAIQGWTISMSNNTAQWVDSSGNVNRVAGAEDFTGSFDVAVDFADLFTDETDIGGSVTLLLRAVTGDDLTAPVVISSYEITASRNNDGDAIGASVSFEGNGAITKFS